MYVSRDIKVKTILNVACFDVRLDGKTLPNKRLDASGRVFLPKTLLSSFGNERMTAKVVAPTLLVIDRAYQKASG